MSSTLQSFQKGFPTSNKKSSMTRVMPSSSTSTSSSLSYKPNLSFFSQEGLVIRNRTVTSLVHCIGDNFLPSAWIYRSCQYSNLYFAQNEWFVVMPQQWKNNYSMGFDVSSMDVVPATTTTTVSLNPATPFSIRKQKYQWSPKMIMEDEFERRTRTITKEENVVGVLLFTPSTILSSTKTFDLLFDVLLPIYILVRLFHEDDEVLRRKVQVYVLEGDDSTTTISTTMATIMTSTQRQWLQTGLQEMLGYHIITNFSSIPIRLERAVVGMGTLSATGLSKRGWDAKDYQAPRAIHNVGRGATFWEFRTAILNHQLEATHDVAIEQMERIRAIFAMPLGSNEWARPLVESLQHHFPYNSSSEYQFDILEDVISWKHDTTSLWGHYLLELALQSNVWIASAQDDEWTWPAFFLPRGSTLILLYDASQKPKRPRNGFQNDGFGGGGDHHPVYPNYGIWNHMSHLQVHWLQQPSNDHYQVETLAKLLQRLIRQQRHDGYAVSNLISEVPPWKWNPVNDVRLVYRSPLPSKVHCIAENWEWDVSNYRSCHVENMCWNMDTQEFQYRPMLESEQALSLLQAHGNEGNVLSTVANNSIQDKHVMMGQTIRRGAGDPWFPTAMTLDKNNTMNRFYSLPSNVVWLPYFAEVPNADNPGHLLWDYFLPLYTLLELFFGPPTKGQGDYPRMLLTHIDFDCVEGSICHKLTTKFLPLLGMDPKSFLTPTDSFLDLHDPLGQSRTPESPWICASHALMGIGMLTDHGIKKHGQLLEDYQNVRNTGRGVAFWRFRNFMMNNMGLLPKRAKNHNPPFLITFSINSSTNPSRRRDFASQIALLQTHYPSSLIQVRAVQLSTLSLRHQLELIQASTIFVSVMGGSASIAMCLERNSSFILYYNDIDDFVQDSQTRKKLTTMPARMDWDFWNHASYLRVHWLPLSTMEQDLHGFGRLIENELMSLIQLVESK